MVAATTQASAESVDDHRDDVAGPADEEVGVGADNGGEKQYFDFYGCLVLTDTFSLVEKACVYSDSGDQDGL